RPDERWPDRRRRRSPAAQAAEVTGPTAGCRWTPAGAAAGVERRRARARRGRRRSGRGGRLSADLHWSDARSAAAGLERRPAERRVLLLLGVLPFLSARVASALLGLTDAARVYLCLAELRAAGLVDVVRPSFRPHGSPRLPYLTDLGLATAAHLEGLDAAEM